ncbi:MAG TPA: hypothetical protein PLZ57_00135 [Pseudobdellovibrionaceae bacterium]|nr:hypothetical protein [Pseudobdellovibrionaceae bacterium]
MATPACPKCSAELRDDYGMVACAGCGAIVFVDMDGIAHMSSEESANPPAAAKFPEADQLAGDESTPTNFNNPPAGEPEASADGDAPLGVFEQPEVASQFETSAAPEVQPLEFDASPQLEASATPHDGAPLEAAPSDDAPAAAAGEEPLNPTESPAEINEDFADFFGETEKPQKSPAKVNPADPLGVSGYAANELSQAKGGGLLFKLRISGIDSKELREEIRQALKDSRFGWSLSEVMGPDRLRGGVLVIPNLNAVKTSIIVNRIKHLPVEIRWEQYAITDVEGPTS